MRSDVRALLWKEFRQLPRKRGAVLTATFFPLLFLVVIPAFNLGAAMMAPAGTGGAPVGVNLPPGLTSAAGDAKGFAVAFTVPLFVMISGLMLPSVMASYTIIAERERRTLELLVALPVPVSSIILAKLITVVVVAAATTVPLLALDSIVLIALGFAGPIEVATFFWLLLTALAYSAASFLIVGLLAGDYRTAANLNGALIAPLLLAVMALLALLPPGTGVLIVGALLLGGAAAITFLAVRRFTFERLIG